MGAGGAALELGVGLAGDEPGMVRAARPSPPGARRGRCPTPRSPASTRAVAVGVVHLVAVAVALVDDAARRRPRAARRAGHHACRDRRPGAWCRPCRSTSCLLGHEVDDEGCRVRCRVGELGGSGARPGPARRGRTRRRPPAAPGRCPDRARRSRGRSGRRRSCPRRRGAPKPPGTRMPSMPPSTVSAFSSVSSSPSMRCTFTWRARRRMPAWRERLDDGEVGVGQARRTCPPRRCPRSPGRRPVARQEGAPGGELDLAGREPQPRAGPMMSKPCSSSRLMGTS